MKKTILLVLSLMMALVIQAGSPVIPCVCLTSPNAKTVKTLICTAMLYEQSF